MSEEPKSVLDRKAGPGAMLSVGCFGIILLFFIIAIFTWYRQVNSPEGKRAAARQEKIQAALKQINDCRRNLFAVTDAMTAFQKANNGKFPENLTKLSPEFLKDKAALHCPAHEAPPETVSYAYAPPKAADGPETTLVTCPHHTISIDTKTAVVQLTIRKNGDIYQRSEERVTREDVEQAARQMR